MTSDLILAPVRDLIGPDLRLHTTKLNMKSAGYGAAVEWHQDFAFYPHTNDDVLAVGVILDDMGMENGPLMVFPGSQEGPIPRPPRGRLLRRRDGPQARRLRHGRRGPADGPGRVDQHPSRAHRPRLRDEPVGQGAADPVLRDDGRRRRSRSWGR